MKKQVLKVVNVKKLNFVVTTFITLNLKVRIKFNQELLIEKNISIWDNRWSEYDCLNCNNTQIKFGYWWEKNENEFNNLNINDDLNNTDYKINCKINTNVSFNNFQKMKEFIEKFELGSIMIYNKVIPYTFGKSVSFENKIVRFY